PTNRPCRSGRRVAWLVPPRHNPGINARFGAWLPAVTLSTQSLAASNTLTAWAPRFPKVSWIMTWWYQPGHSPSGSTRTVGRLKAYEYLFKLCGSVICRLITRG